MLPNRKITKKTKKLPAAMNSSIKPLTSSKLSKTTPAVVYSSSSYLSLSLPYYSTLPPTPNLEDLGFKLIWVSTCNKSRAASKNH